jgi:tetratricopeptide (TPR) repeat protein
MQRSLAINNQIGRLEGQAAQLGNLGTCYQLLGDVPKAIEFHEQALAIDETLNGRASHLGNLGRCYQHLGDVPKAIDSFERCLALLEAMGLPDSHPNVSMARKSLEALRVTSEISC